jgi:trimeric autotransporter adhesin
MKNLLPRIKLTSFLAVAYLALASVALAVDPPPDGGYSGFNTAEGEDALFSLTTGVSNTALGFDALYSNTTGFGNTANGVTALRFNTTGIGNTATGADALSSNTNGSNNTANGAVALTANTEGSNNTANGASALLNSARGSNNTAIGFNALATIRTGENNIALGVSAGNNLKKGDSNNIDIGNAGDGGESNTIRIGMRGTQTNTYIAGISGVTVANGVGVIVNPQGQLGTVVSSERFKDSIKPMDKASEAILALEPVTFRYKHELDPEGIPQFGLVAEQVEKVNPDLVARDDQGKPYTVRYEAVNAMLLNEFLKEHRKVEEQEATIGQVKSTAAKQDVTITDLKSTVAQQQKEIQALTAQIQKVNDRLEISKPAPQMVADNW